ncbi:MAG: diadenylate cyclase CdaA [Spirochaetaceae bacterium]|nr:diadenylate cyclase CdaA [Spirochaetaceae bacterium]
MTPATILAFLATYVRPVLDVAILAFLIYQTYRLLVMTEALYLIRGLLVLAAIYGAAFFLRLSTVTWIMNILAPGLVVSLAIILQPELRRIFIQVGRQSLRGRPSTKAERWLDDVIAASYALAAKKRGALMVITRKVGLGNFAEKGIELDAVISSHLLIAMFEHDNPLHDGAAILSEGRVLAAACFLPLSNQQDILLSFGSRHRAALGIAEETDAVVVVVSEETGAVSLVYDSRIYYNLSQDELAERLRSLFPGGVVRSRFEVKDER